MLGISPTSKPTNSSINNDFSLYVLDSSSKTVSINLIYVEFLIFEIISESDDALNTGKIRIEEYGSFQKTHNNLILVLSRNNNSM